MTSEEASVHGALKGIEGQLHRIASILNKLANIEELKELERRVDAADHVPPSQAVGVERISNVSPSLRISLLALFGRIWNK